MLAAGDQEIRQTADALATAPTVQNDPGADITALSVNVANGARVWRALGDLVQRSLDNGVTWTDWGIPASGVDVLDILEDPVVNDSVFCLVGADFYHSTASPGVWSVFYAGPTGATARWIQRSISGDITWICYEGTFTGSPLQRVEGGLSVTFPVLSPVVSEIRAIALNDMFYPAAPQIIAIDQEARLFIIDALTGAVDLQSAATFPAGTIVQHAQHSYKAPVVYTADFDSVATGTGAIRKYLYQGDSLLLMHEGDTGQQAHMVGIGGFGTQVTAKIYITTLGESGAEDRLWFYDPAVSTWAGITYPQSGWFWHDFKVDPFNPQRMLLLGNNVGGAQQTSMSNSGGTVRSNDGSASPLYLSEDGGATWQAIDLTGLTSTPGINSVRWSESFGGTWYTCANTFAGTPSYFWRGTVGGGTSFAAALTSATRIWTFALSGQSGEAVVVDFGGGREIGYISPGNTLTEPGGTNAAMGDFTEVDVLPSARRFVGVTGLGEIIAGSDYRAAQPTVNLTSTIGDPYTFQAIAITADGSVYIPTTDGVGKIATITGTPVQELIYPFVPGTFRIATDKQTRTVVVAGQGDGSTATNLIIFDGTTWGVLAGPSFTAPLFGALEAVVG
jgi:hypothetical protein